MPNDLEELEALNTAAIETMTKLEATDRRQGSFWDADNAKSFRPSQQNVSVPLFESSRKYDDVVPRKYYRSSFGATESHGYNQMSDNFYRKMLVSVYKNQQPHQEEQTIGKKRVARIISPESMATMSLSFSINPTKPEYFYMDVTESAQTNEGEYGVAVPNAKQPAVSDHTKHQLTAIVMSGFLRILTTMVLNWARDRQVPYELL